MPTTETATGVALEQGIDARGTHMRGLTAATIGLNALYVVSQTFIARRLGPVARDALRLQTTTSDVIFRAILDGWDDVELARYRSHLTPDMVHPLIYAASLTASALQLDELRPLSPPLRRALLIAPWISATADYAENVAHLYLLAHRSRITPGMIRSTGTITNTKWALAGGCVAILGGGYLRMLLRPSANGPQSTQGMPLPSTGRPWGPGGAVVVAGAAGAVLSASAR